MPATTRTLSLALAEFVAGCDYESIPAPIRDKARMHLLDSVGVAAASAGFDFAAAAHAGFARLGRGDFQVIGMPQPLALRDAVCMNGLLVHGIEYDDTSAVARLHPSSVCVPAALGAGAFAHTSGKAMLAAYVAGIECAIRLGAAAKGGFSPSGFNATGVVGAFAAALTAGKLLGLGVAQLASAQGIAYGTAAGNRESVAADAWTKRLDPGWAAASGLAAATLAGAGYLGPRTPYEGRHGLYRVYLRHEVTAQDLDSITADLGSRWAFAELSLKSLPACYFNHPLINSTIAIMQRHDLAASSIRRIGVFLPRAGIDTVCEPAAPKMAPGDLATALFSAYFTVAVAAARRRFSLADLEPEVLKDPELLALARKVTYAIDAESTFPRHYSGAVEIETMEGRVYSEREDVNKGSPERPMSQVEIEAKFMDNACRALSRPRAQALMDAILDIEHAADVSAVRIAADD